METVTGPVLEKSLDNLRLKIGLHDQKRDINKMRSLLFRELKNRFEYSTDNTCKYKLINSTNMEFTPNLFNNLTAYLKPGPGLPENHLETFIKVFNESVEIKDSWEIVLNTQPVNNPGSIIQNITNNTINDNSINITVNNFFKIDSVSINNNIINQNRHLLNHEYEKNDYNLADLYKKLHIESPYPHDVNSTSNIIKSVQSVISHDPATKDYLTKSSCGTNIPVKQSQLDFPFTSRDDNNKIYNQNLSGVVQGYRFSLIKPEDASKIKDVTEYNADINNGRQIYELVDNKIKTVETILGKYLPSCEHFKEKGKYNLHTLYDKLDAPIATEDKRKLEIIIGSCSNKRNLTHNIRSFIGKYPSFKYEERYDKEHKLITGSSNIPVIFLRENSNFVNLQT